MAPPTRPNLALNSEFVFDAIIIGAGPAGLSAALTLCRVKRPAIVFSTPTFRNDRADHAHGILSRDHTPPSEIRNVSREQINAYGTVRFVERAVTKACKKEDSNLFEVQDESGEKWQGKKLVLATGVRDVLPHDIPGYEENWGNSIYQCLMCDGIERSDQPAGTLGVPDMMSLHNIHTILQIGCPRATIFTSGAQMPTDEGLVEMLEVVKARGAVVDERRIKRLHKVRDPDGVQIEFDDGSKIRVGFLAHRPSTELNAQHIISDLGMETVPDGAGGRILKRNEPFGESNIGGVFVAGDAGIMMKSVPQAISQGQLAGAGVHATMIEDEKKQIRKKMKASIL